MSHLVSHCELLSWSWPCSKGAPKVVTVLELLSCFSSCHPYCCRPLCSRIVERLCGCNNINGALQQVRRHVGVTAEYVMIRAVAMPLVCGRFCLIGRVHALCPLKVVLRLHLLGHLHEDPAPDASVDLCRAILPSARAPSPPARADPRRPCRSCVWLHRTQSVLVPWPSASSNIEHLPLLEMTQARYLELIHTETFVEDGHLGWVGRASARRSGVFMTHVARELAR